MGRSWTEAGSVALQAQVLGITPQSRNAWQPEMQAVIVNQTLVQFRAAWPDLTRVSTSHSRPETAGHGQSLITFANVLNLVSLAPSPERLTEPSMPLKVIWDFAGGLCNFRHRLGCGGTRKFVYELRDSLLLFAMSRKVPLPTLPDLLSPTPHLACSI